MTKQSNDVGPHGTKRSPEPARRREVAEGRAVGVGPHGTKRSPQPAWNEALGFAGMAFTLRLFFIAIYPALYGGDPIARMLHPERLVLAYQLPLLQVLVALVYGFVDHPLAARLLSAAIGAFATFGVYVLTLTLAGRTSARCAAAFFLANPLIVVYSLMPYQEPLMIGLVSLAGAFWLMRREWPMSLALGLACLTRYESWVVAAVLMGAAVHRDRHRLRALGFSSAVAAMGRYVLLFGWAPLFWIAGNGGIAPAGTYVADPAGSWARLERLPYLAERVLVYAPFAVVLAPWGLWWTRRAARRGRWSGFIAAVAAVTAAIVALAHDYPPGTSSVSERMSHVPLTAAIVLSAFGLARLMGWEGRRKSAGAVVATIALVAILGSSILLSVRQVRARSAEPPVATTRHLADYLSRRLIPGERALIVARPVEESLIRHYLELIERRKPEEIEAAHRLVSELALPELYQRLVVSLPRGRERLVEVGSWRGEPVAVAVVFEDARDRIPRELLLSPSPLAIFGEGPEDARAPVARVYFTAANEVSR